MLKPSPVPRGEKRLEYLVAHLRGHAAAGVAHGEHRIGTRANVWIHSHIGFVEHDVGRLQHQLAAVRHRVSCIDRQIQQRIGELRGIDVNGRHLVGKAQLDLDLLAQRRPEQLSHFLDGLVDIDLARLQRLLAGECQQMLDQFGATIRGLVDQGCHLLEVAAVAKPGH